MLEQPFGVSEQLALFARTESPEATPTNPRYLAYCRAHGHSDHDAMIAADRETWPGGKMCGFTVWIQQRWREWLKARGRKHDDVKSEDDHREFDAWLQVRAPSPDELIRNAYKLDAEQEATT